MLIAGIGCRRNSEVSVLLQALERALRQFWLKQDMLIALASGDNKRDEPALLQAAQHLQLPVHFASKAQLQAMEPLLLSTSAASLAASGSSSLSEASALVFAGRHPRLLAPRYNFEGVSIAFAKISGEKS